MGCVTGRTNRSYPRVTHTGVAQNTITWIPNLLIRGNPVSDYDGAIELQDALNAKNSQVGRVLLKHSDPRLAFPEELFDEQGNVRSDHEVFAFHDPKRLPQYITWDAELQHAMADRAFILNQLLVRTETSPVTARAERRRRARGVQEGPPGKFQQSLESRAQGGVLESRVAPGAGRRAGAGERHSPAAARYERGPLGIQLRDGIPLDELDRAQRLAVLRGAGLISVERALEEELQDPSAVAKELARLEGEAVDTGPLKWPCRASRDSDIQTLIYTRGFHVFFSLPKFLKRSPRAGDRKDQIMSQPTRKRRHGRAGARRRMFRGRSRS